jgi:hypothetical protein
MGNRIWRRIGWQNTLSLPVWEREIFLQTATKHSANLSKYIVRVYRCHHQHNQYFCVKTWRCSWSLHLRLGLLISRRLRGWHWKANFGRRLLSIYFRWSNQFCLLLFCPLLICYGCQAFSVCLTMVSRISFAQRLVLGHLSYFWPSFRYHSTNMLCLVVVGGLACLCDLREPCLSGLKLRTGLSKQIRSKWIVQTKAGPSSLCRDLRWHPTTGLAIQKVGSLSRGLNMLLRKAQRHRCVPWKYEIIPAFCHLPYFQGSIWPVMIK